MAELRRGYWWILEGCGNGEPGGATIEGLIGAIREPDGSEHQWYLEYIWIDPGSRRQGLAQILIRHAVSYLVTEDEEATVSLWVLEGNHAAYHLYDQLGFKEEGTIQHLNDSTGRREILMELVAPRELGQFTAPDAAK